MIVYGIENKDGFFYNFVLHDWSTWSEHCQLPSKDLADNLLMLYEDNPTFCLTKVSPVSLENI